MRTLIKEEKKMEEINVNETINDVVENITTGNDLGIVLKALAGAGGTTLAGLGLYKGCKLLNQKVVKPMIAKRKAKKESKPDNEPQNV